MVRARQKTGRVAAPAPEPGPDRNALREPRADSAEFRLRGLLGDEVPGLLHQIGAARRDREPPRLEREARGRGLEGELVLERYRLQDRIDLVVAVLAAPKNPKAEVDLRRAPDPDRRERRHGLAARPGENGQDRDRPEDHVRERRAVAEQMFGGISALVLR